jgi:2-polyprenyl-3-methyl-5-hydroxy-6-metoxy-1,4-benzoquinol methylase
MDSGARFIALSHRSSPWVDSQLALVQSVCPAPAKILDAGCGAGDLALRLTESGYVVVGLEPDRAIFEVLLERTQRAGAHAGRFTPLPVSFQECTFDSSRFDALLAMSVYSFLPLDEQQSFVQWAATKLIIGGVLVISAVYSGAEIASDEWQEIATHPIGAASLVIRVRSCAGTAESQSVEYEYAFLVDEEVASQEVARQTMYPTQHEDLLRLLALNGLETRAVFADWTGGAYSIGSRFAVIVAERTIGD